MLEHADRDDPVELPFELAIIDQLELDMVGDAGLLGALAGDLQLLFRQGDAEHVDAGDLVQVERHAAPAAADVEHALARLQVRAWRRCAPSCRPAPARGCCRVGEIGAAVLQVVVEEELVELVARGRNGGRRCAATRAGLLRRNSRFQPLLALADSACGRLPPSSQRLAPVISSSRSRIVPSSIDQPPVHIGFAERRAAGCGRCRTATLRSVKRTVSVLAAAGPVGLAAARPASTMVMLPACSSLSTSLPINAIATLLLRDRARLALALRRGLQLAAGGVDVAAARRAHRRRNAGFEDDVAERPDPLVGSSIRRARRATG